MLYTLSGDNLTSSFSKEKELMYIEHNFSMVLDRKKCICEINFKMHWSYYKMCQLLQNVTFFKKCIGKKMHRYSQ